jgi:hypothetical protein
LRIFISAGYTTIKSDWLKVIRKEKGQGEAQNLAKFGANLRPTID